MARAGHVEEGVDAGDGVELGGFEVHFGHVVADRVHAGGVLGGEMEHFLREIHADDVPAAFEEKAGKRLAGAATEVQQAAFFPVQTREKGLQDGFHVEQAPVGLVGGREFVVNVPKSRFHGQKGVIFRYGCQKERKNDQK